VQARAHVGVEVEVDAELAAALSSRSHEIVQLTREALSNVARHARARHATVSLVRKATRAMLSIEDDGIGFDPRSESTGNGLRNMRARAASLGGEMRVTSRNGKGSRLQVTFPV
jgi:two-component system NarL family sensor kinase